MAEGFEPYHVPQQSRRDKLRVSAAASELAGLLPEIPPPTPYDHRHVIDLPGNSPPSDLLTCTPMAGLGSSSSSSLSLRSHIQNPYGTFDPSFLYGDQVVNVVFKPEPLSLSLSSFNNGGEGLGNDGVLRSSVPLGPFTGYASVLKGSRFLRPAQQLLEELCCEVVGVVSPEKLAPDSSLLVMDTNAIVDDDDDGDDHDNDDDDDDDDGSDVVGLAEIRKKKSRLISMLDEVYRRYKQYYQQMQAVVTSFEYVAGISNAAPYANLAVKAMTRHFRCLKNAIMDQLQFTKDNNAYPGHRKDEVPSSFRSTNRGIIYGQRPTHAPGFLDHQPVWRPQRGLPERAVTVLRAWLFEHFLHPYPTDTDKLMLAKQTGLSRSQVSNWFINARVRLWKPMVEEIHTLEMRQAQKAASQRDHDHNHNNNAAPPPSNSVPSTSKRSRNELPSLPAGGHEASLSYNGDGLAGQLHAAAAANGVSLTLGLHQDGGICLAQRFGLGLDGGGNGGGGDGFVMSAFEAQNRHFGGQLLHDFVG